VAEQAPGYPFRSDSGKVVCNGLTIQGYSPPAIPLIGRAALVGLTTTDEFEQGRRHVGSSATQSRAGDGEEAGGQRLDHAARRNRPAGRYDEMPPVPAIEHGTVDSSGGSRRRPASHPP